LNGTGIVGRLSLRGTRSIQRLLIFRSHLFIASVVFDLLAVWRTNRGLSAWQWQLEGIGLKSDLLHVVFALATDDGESGRSADGVFGTAGEVPGRFSLGSALGTVVPVVLAGHLVGR
jgi:hypothetical protein